MKILQVNKFNYGHGGADHYFLDLCKQLTTRGHSVARFCMDHPKNIQSEWSSYFVSNVDYKNGSAWNKLIGLCRVIYSIEARIKFARLCDDFQPDVIHIHNIYHQISPSILSVAKKRQIPVFMHLHDYKILCPNYDLYAHDSVYTRCLGGKYYRCILDKCFKNSLFQSMLVVIEMYLHHTLLNFYGRSITQFIAPSDFIASLVKGHRLDLADRIQTITYGIEVPLCKQVNDKPNGKRYFVTYGYFHRQKGFDLAIKALMHIARPPILYVIGSGEQEGQLRALARRCGVADHVIFTGRLGRQMINQRVSGAVATIVPSRWFEVFGLVIIESFAVGTCVIGSRMGAIPDIIENHKNGLLFRNNDEKDLAEKMNVLLDNKSMKRTLDKHALTTAKEKHKINVHLDTLTSLYEKFLA